MALASHSSCHHPTCYQADLTGSQDLKTRFLGMILGQQLKLGQQLNHNVLVQFDNGTAYCNCNGTGYTGTNCQVSQGTPAPSPNSSATAPSPASGPSLTPATGPSLAAAGVPPVSSPLRGSCPQGWGPLLNP